MEHAADQRLCIILLAAGAASRFGSAKQVADIDGIGMVTHCALNALRTNAPVIVVVGAHRESVERELRDLDVVLVSNETWQRGMGGSISSGVRAAVARYPQLEAIVILLADQPAISSEHLLALMRRHNAQPDCIVASKAHDALGPPCVFPQSLFEELIDLHDQPGARQVIDRHCDTLIEFDLPEAAIDIDSPADHAAFRTARAPA